MDVGSILITGANGQLGKALSKQYPGAVMTDSSTLDISSQQAVDNYDWSAINVIINAAAYTSVDAAETPEGRVAAWKANALGAANLARVAREKDILLFHISTDYVYDGSQQLHYEIEPFAPLNVYGASKAAGDIAISLAAKHYILRTSWVIGDGKNFVRTMLNLATNGINPSVVSDQLGRPTFTDELVRVIDHFLKTKPAFGTYHATNDGEPVSWANFAREIFKESGSQVTVTDTTTAQYFQDMPQSAPRPLSSVFDLTKLKSTGYAPRDWHQNLKEYLASQSNPLTEQTNPIG